jgi:hypothetical protein
MTNLSSAAQAILDAYQFAPIEDELTAAAVLRTAANQIEDLYCDGDVEDSPGIVFALCQLMLIADELEVAK